jgi:N-acyl-D-aspartate/D-glutamate deacylase
VLLRDGRVAFVGTMDTDTLDVQNHIDATGLIVAPGFIDAHAHGNPVGEPYFPNFLAMGVTTIVLGQDGGGPQVSGLSAHMDSLDAARPSVNVAYLVGHNTIRRESGVGFDEPDAEGLARMSSLVAEGLEAGAFGLSTGLEYDPGSRADVDELIAIAMPVAAADGVVSSHLRSEDADKVGGALEELIEQGRRSGARIHASHLKIVLESDPSAAAALLEAMETARADGVGITGDVYPYVASYTGIGILFPEWARGPNDYATVVSERRDELAAHLRGRVESRNGPEATLFGSSEWAGRTLAEVASETGQVYEDVLIDLGPSGASAAYFVMDEGIMSALLADPNIVVSSDGSPTMLHPRGHGAFPRVLRQYAIEGDLFTLEEAIHKMSGLTANTFRLDDGTRVDVRRGQVQEGWAADLIVFDPAAVRDPATFGDPHQLAEGMHAVFVGGQPAWMNGRPVDGDGYGRVVRSRNPAGN